MKVRKLQYYNTRYCCLPSGCENPGDVVFALDSSGSIKKENFQLMVDFAKRLVMELPIDDRTRVGLETYADNARVRTE